MKTLSLLFNALLALAAVSTHAHDAPARKAPASNAAQPEEKPFGRAGNVKQVARTVTIAMSDRMRFVPDTLTVRRGETLRLRVRNNGGMLHELVLGTLDELKQHAELMKQYPGMEHDEPHMVHVASGKAGEVVWQFNRPGTFYFACLIPGHFEAGMIGKITVKP